MQRPTAVRSTAQTRAPWSAVEIPQTPVAGMPGDDFFTRGQMCLSLLQTSRPRRRRPRATALHSGRTAGLAPALLELRGSHTPPGSSPDPCPSPRPLCLSCSRHGCAKSGPSSRPALRRPVILRPGTAPTAPGGHSRSGLLQPSPSLPSSPQLLPRLPHTLLSPPPPVFQPCSAPPAATLSRQTASKRMKILIKNLSPSRTQCQKEGQHLCPHSQRYLVLVPAYTNSTPTPKETSKMQA